MVATVSPTRRPPGPPPGLIGGNALEFRKGPVQFLMENSRLYGDVVAYRLLSYEFWQLNHPEDIREILLGQAHKVEKAPIYKQMLSKYLGNGLLNSDGAFWRRQRSLVAPAFHHRRVNTYADLMVQYTLDMIEGWREQRAIDIYEAMTQLTLYIVVKTLFNTDIRGQAAEIGDLTATLQELVSSEQNSPLRLPDWVPTPANRAKRHSIERLHAIPLEVIRERRTSGEDHGDLLSMLLSARGENGEAMSDEEIMYEALTIFLAGHDTTANAMTWAWYLLAQHPEVKARLHRTVDEALGGRPATLEDLPRLKYVEMIVKEVLRLYPPSFSVARRTLEPVTLRDGWVIPPDMNVIVSQYVVQHDARWFAEPERFDPERFSPENEEKIGKYTYFPFIYGPRVCVGNQFAMMEAILIVATIAQRYDMVLRDTQPVPMRALLTLNPAHGIEMVLTPR